MLHYTQRFAMGSKDKTQALSDACKVSILSTKPPLQQLWGWPWQDQALLNEGMGNAIEGTEKTK